MEEYSLDISHYLEKRIHFRQGQGIFLFATASSLLTNGHYEIFPRSNAAGK
jgi:hypothetical protein